MSRRKLKSLVQYIFPYASKVWQACSAVQCISDWQGDSKPGWEETQKPPQQEGWEGDTKPQQEGWEEDKKPQQEGWEGEEKPPDWKPPQPSWNDQQKPSEWKGGGERPEWQDQKPPEWEGQKPASDWEGQKPPDWQQDHQQKPGWEDQQRPGGWDEGQKQPQWEGGKSPDWQGQSNQGWDEQAGGDWEAGQHKPQDWKEDQVLFFLRQFKDTISSVIFAEARCRRRVGRGAEAAAASSRLEGGGGGRVAADLGSRGKTGDEVAGGDFGLAGAAAAAAAGGEHLESG